MLLIAAILALAAYGWLCFVFRNSHRFDERLADFNHHVQTLPVPVVNYRPEMSRDEFEAAWVEIVNNEQGAA